MPKYNVSLTRTTTIIYDTVEIEADDHTAAQAMAVTMVEDGELSEDSENDTFAATIEDVVEG